MMQNNNIYVKSDTPSTPVILDNAGAILMRNTVFSNTTQANTALIESIGNQRNNFIINYIETLDLVSDAAIDSLGIINSNTPT